MTEASQVIALLTARKRSLATAESCTGGFLGKLLTDVPGASAAYLGGVISYAYSVKEALLNVDPHILDQKGAVCPEVAKQMAEGVREALHADYAISTTGNAGPGTDDRNPNVGELYIGIASGEGSKVYRLRLTGDREANRLECCRAALQFFLEELHD